MPLSTTGLRARLADVGEVDVLTAKVAGHVVDVARGLRLGDHAHDDAREAAAVQAARASANAPQVERVACMNAGDSPLEITAMEGLLPEGLTFRCEPQVLQPWETGDLVIGFDPARLKTALPDTLPVILEGLALPPSRRTHGLDGNR